MGLFFRRPALVGLLVFIGAVLGARAAGRLRPSQGGLSRGDVALEARVASPLKAERQGSKCVLKAASSARVEAFFPRSFGQGRIPLTGQSAIFSGKLRRPRPARNPGEFDERAFLADRGIGWILAVRRVRAVAPAPWRLRPLAAAESLRRGAERVFSLELPDPVSARVLDGLALGDKGPLPRAVNAAVQDAGVMHLLVPSGAKVGLVLAAAAALAWALGLSPWPRFAVSAAAGGAYTVMVGAEPPYARAYWCALALSAGLACGRECAPFEALVLSAWAVLLVEPRDLFSLGFQMTYVAALGLCLALPRLQARLPESWPGPLRWSAEAVAVSAVVQAVLAPLLAAAFGRVSLVAVISNVALVPLAAVATACAGLVWAAAAAGCGRLAFDLGRVDGLLVRLFLAGCRWFASWPEASVDVPALSGASVAAYYLALAAVLAWPRRRWAKALAAAAVLTAAPRARALERTPGVEILYLALPKGQAAIVTWQGRRRWLVEGGARAGPILRALKALGGPPVTHIVADESPSSTRALGRLRARAPGAAVERRAAFEWRLGRGAFRFWPPALRRGPDEFSIIGVRRRRAVTASSDGITFQIREAGD